MSTNRYKFTVEYSFPIYFKDTGESRINKGKEIIFAEKEPTMAEYKKIIAEDCRRWLADDRMFRDDEIQILNINNEPADPPSRSFSDVLAIISCLTATALAVYCIIKSLYQ